MLKVTHKACMVNYLVGPDMHGYGKFCQRGSNFVVFFPVFLVDEGREDQSIPPPPPSVTPLKWRFAGVPMMAQY